jgi:hypothetical protein
MPWPSHFQATENSAQPAKRANDECNEDSSEHIVSDLEIAALHAGDFVYEDKAAKPSSFTSKPRHSKVTTKVASFLNSTEEEEVTKKIELFLLFHLLFSDVSYSFAHITTKSYTQMQNNMLGR